MLQLAVALDQERNEREIEFKGEQGQIQGKEVG